MSNPVIKIRFADTTAKEGSVYAQELEECLQATAPKLKFNRASDQPQAQGLGEFLVAVLPYVPGTLHITSTMALAVIEGIHVWLQLKGHGNKEVEIEVPDGSNVRVDRKTAELTAALLKALAPSDAHGAKPA